jgi:uncharacterized protein YndB with AHSA1/START domain
MTESIAPTHDGRTKLRIERRFEHPREKVWRAVTESEHLAHWFPFDVKLDLRPGGAMSFTEKANGGGVALDGTVLELDAPRLFTFDWNGEILRFELEADGDATILVFTHTFVDHYGAASFTAGWQTCLNALDDDLAGREPAPMGPSAMAAQHDAFVEQFGLDNGVVEERADGWRVRFERQLTRPNEDAWAALVGDAPVRIGQPAPEGVVLPGMDETMVQGLDPAHRLEYEWSERGKPVGRVSLEFGDGTGQGGRIVVAQSGPPNRADRRDQALVMWKMRLTNLAATLRAS